MTNTYVVPDPHCGGELNDANWIDWWVVRCPEGVDGRKAYADGESWAQAYRAVMPDIESDSTGYRKWYDDSRESFRLFMAGLGYVVEGPFKLAWIGTL